MNFQKFCNNNQNVDEQVVSLNNSFVISFGKSGGTTFNVDPEDIAIFLKFLSENHAACKYAIESDPAHTASSYTCYKEKPYRALYKLTESESTLNTIRSLGGSQTKELTKVISKLICYLSGATYKAITQNTYFDKVTVDLALKNMPSDLKVLASDLLELEKSSNSNNELLFKEWLKEKGLSEKSIKNYAGSTINKVNAIFYGENDSRTIYDLSSVEQIEDVITELGKSDAWLQMNASGKEMWNTGINHYLVFLKELKPSTHLPKPFLLLAGISGTGKTRFVREQARATDPTLKNYCLVPVRPDWHEPSDLLGYISRLSGHAEYVTTDVLTFIVKAWQSAAPNADKAGIGDINEQSTPYWLCLDEMNLAPVEQYFADYLSVLESRKFDENGYQCEALLNANMLQRLIETDTKLPNNLGLSSSDDLWKYFLEHGISLPPNLIVAGTVNMDETTHGFSRKVIDRAITLDFGEFFPNVYADYFDQKIEPVVFTWSALTHGTEDSLASTVDVDGTKSIEFLEAVNIVLKRTPFELAYRALNELLLQVACLKPKNESELQAIWDDFLMTKVLPRIDGDEDKLRLLTDGGEGTLLDGLMSVLEVNLPLIWNDGRKDFFRLNIDGTNTSDIICRSKAKLAWMKDRLAINTFTSYWP